MTKEIAAYLLRDYHTQWTSLLVVIVLLSAWWVKGRVGYSAAALLIYCTLNAMYIWVWSLNRYYPVMPYDQQAIRFHAADALIKLLVVVAPILAMRLGKTRRIGRVFWPAIFWVNCFAIILERALVQDCSAENVCGGIIGNPSMSASFIAATLPLAWSPIAVLAAALAVYITKSSVGLGLLAVAIALHFRPKYFGFAAMTAAGIVGSGWLWLGKELLNPSDRFRIWRIFMDLWDAPWNIPLGMGYGIFPAISLNIQGALKMQDARWWFFMHNDWLEMLFNCGVIGAALMVLVYLVAIDRLWARKMWPELRALVVYGLFMTLNYPARLAIPSLLGAYLVASGVRLDPLYLSRGRVHNLLIRRFHESFTRRPIVVRLSRKLRSIARLPFHAGDR